MNSTKALSRTWQTVTTYRECGVTVDVSRDTVSLFRVFVGGPLLATIDGEACEVARAVSLLRNADEQPTLTAETLAPQTIGKARASKLHKHHGPRVVCPASSITAWPPLRCVSRSRWTRWPP